jgi:phenylacetate-CoA ligase
LPRTSIDQFIESGFLVPPDLDFDAQVPFESVEKIAALTNRLLARHVCYCYEHSSFYRQRFDNLGIKTQDVHSIADICRLPFTTKADIAEHGSEMLCVPSCQVVDICQTSGTTGTPVALPQTERDLQRLAYNEQLCFSAAGLKPGDRVVIACAFDRCFMAGLAYFMGLRRLGATAIRAGTANSSILTEAIIFHKPSAIIGVPSLLLETGRLLQKRGVAPSGLGIRKLICIGEPVRDTELSPSPLGKLLSQMWAAQVLGTYASTEMATSFAECEQGCAGGHIHPDLIAVEILDESGNPVPNGQAGEVVATPLQVTGMPLLRFRTGDVATLLTEPCPCGRKTYRLGPVLGRKSQMLKIRGTTVYPGAIFAALQSIEGICNYCLELHQDYDLSDRVCVVVGLENGVKLTGEEIADRIRGRVRVKMEVRIASADEIRKRTMVENKRKPVLIFDYRTQRKIGLS